jgi:hypothetical protein
MSSGRDILSIKAIKASKDKVDRVIFHPVQPWVAYSERNNAVTVWNYESNEVCGCLTRSRFCFLYPKQSHLCTFFVTLIDFSSQRRLSLPLSQVIYSNQLGGADDGALQEAALRKRADAVAAAAGAPPAQGLSPAQEASLATKSAASGSVNDLAFLDIDTCFWQIALQRWMQYGAHDAASIPAMSHIRGVDGRRWIIAACENKVTLHDLASSQSLDLSRSGAFESKSPTRLAFMFLNSPSLTGAMAATAKTASAGAAAPHLSPVLAVGVSSGAIYLVSPTSMTVFAKLTGAHRGAITALCPLGGETLGAPDRLVSTSADGTVAIWDPSRTPVRGSDREMAPVKSFKAHESGIKDATFFISYSGDKPEELPLRLATVGDDKKLCLWNVSNWGTLDKLQPLPKASCHSVKFAPWGGAGLGVHPSLIIASGESTALLGVNPATKHIIPLIDLQGMIDPGSKKIPKVYHFSVHPTRPYLMVAATNTGVVLLTADPGELPAVVALPAQVMTLEALMHASEAKEEQAAAVGGAAAAGASVPAGKGALGLTYVMATQGKLWSTALRMESRAK